MGWLGVVLTAVSRRFCRVLLHNHNFHGYGPPLRILSHTVRLAWIVRVGDSVLNFGEICFAASTTFKCRSENMANVRGGGGAEGAEEAEETTQQPSILKKTKTTVRMHAAAN